MTVLAGALCAPSARADASAAADALFRQGREALERGDAQSACVYFADSYKLEPTVGTLLNLAACSSTLGRTASALDSTKEALDRMRPGDDRRSMAQAEAARLRAIVPHVKLDISSECAEPALSHDGKPLPASTVGLAFAVDPGVHHVSLGCRGRAGTTASYVAEPAQTAHIVLVAGAALAVAPASAPTPLAQDSRPWSWAALGGGGVLLAGGALTGVWLLQDASTVNRDCDSQTHLCRTVEGDEAKERGRVLEWVTPALLGTGAVLGGIGAYGLLRPAPKAAPSAALQWSIGLASLRVHGVF